MKTLSPQTQAFLRSLLKIVGGALLAHGFTRAAAVVNASDTVELVFGIGAAVYGYWLSHQKASQIPVVAVPTGNTTPSGNTEYIMRPANAVITKNDPTPKNVVAPEPETVQVSSETPAQKTT